jgi:hypothetical protein
MLIVFIIIEFSTKSSRDPNFGRDLRLGTTGLDAQISMPKEIYDR